MQLYKKVCEFSLNYVAIAVVSGLCMADMISCYRTVGEKLTTRLREQTFAYVGDLFLKVVGRVGICTEWRRAVSLVLCVTCLQAR